MITHQSHRSNDGLPTPQDLRAPAVAAGPSAVNRLFFVHFATKSHRANCCRLPFRAIAPHNPRHAQVYRTGTPNNLSAAVGSMPVPWGVSSHGNCAIHNEMNSSGMTTAATHKMRVVNKTLAFNVRGGGDTLFLRPRRRLLAVVVQDTHSKHTHNGWDQIRPLG